MTNGSITVNPLKAQSIFIKILASTIFILNCALAFGQCHASKFPDPNPELTLAFAEKKGSLSIPAEMIEKEVCYIYQDYYSELNSEVRMNVNESRLYVETGPNAQALSVFDGSVSKVLEIDNRFAVLVRHGRYLTVYDNLDVLFVEEGEEISENQAIGNIKSDNSDSILRFEIWHGMNRLDPKDWVISN